MARLDAEDERFGTDPGADFRSPFPSADANASAIFNGLLAQVKTVGKPGDGVLASMQMDGWASAQRRLLWKAWTSPLLAGIRSDWIDELAFLSPQGRARGLFGRPVFAATTSSSTLLEGAALVGLDLATDLVGAVPFIGNIGRAAIGLGKFMYGLAQEPEEIEKRTPFEEYSRDVDEDVINHALSPLVSSVDWTPCFAPALDWSAGFEMVKTDKGEQSRAFGTFTGDGEPLDVGGVGFMPGTEKITQIVQVSTVYKGPSSRFDAVVDVGSFWPATAQALTGLWQTVNKAGAPEMYTVQAAKLREDWRAYFDALYAGGFDKWPSAKDFDERLYRSKLLAPFIVNQRDENTPKDEWLLGITTDYLTGPYIDPQIFTDDFVPLAAGTIYHRADDAFIIPALDALRQRQLTMLSRSIVCALVRPVAVGELPAFAAFEDPGPAMSGAHDTFGEQLRERCLEMREQLLSHHARFELAYPEPGVLTFDRWAPDVRAVDPPFAEKLEATFGAGLPLKAPGLQEQPLVPETPESEPAPPPEGGPAFPFEESREIDWPVLLSGLGLGTLVTGTWAYETDQWKGFDRG